MRKPEFWTTFTPQLRNNPPLFSRISPPAPIPSSVSSQSHQATLFCTSDSLTSPTRTCPRRVHVPSTPCPPPPLIHPRHPSDPLYRPPAPQRPHPPPPSDGTTNLPLVRPYTSCTLMMVEVLSYGLHRVFHAAYPAHIHLFHAALPPTMTRTMGSSVPAVPTTPTLVLYFGGKYIIIITCSWNLVSLDCAITFQV
ncbi:hypothetical protein BD779DRAFT_284458 [Infundibulicybe gibba]|nr:hypothetical protein BD779DRAFT_284458 [Infundibulicybe gibba]